MGNISNEAELKARIRELELKTIQQQKALKQIARSTAHSFQPANLFKIGLTNVKKVAMTRDVRSMAINTFVGLAAGYITRRFVIGKNSNIFKRTLGAAVQAGITKMVYRKLPEWQEKTAKMITDISHQSKR
jgi:uncharacterized membrane protein YjjP (DUF1212 family)